MGCRPALPRPGEEILAAARFAPEFVLLCLQAHDLGSQRTGLFHQALVGFAAAAEFFGVLVGVNEIADEVEQQFLKYLEAVRVVNEIAEQDVILEKKRLVGPAFQKQKAVAEEFVDFREFLAEEGAARFRQRVFIQLAHDLIDRHSHLAIDAAALALQLRDSRPHHVRLLAALEMDAARVNPLFALDDQAGELAGDLAQQEFQNGEAIEDIHLDVLRVFGARQRNLKKFEELLAKARGIGRRGVAPLAIGKIQTGDGANAVEQVFARRLGEFRAQVNVIVDVVEADVDALQMQLDGIRLELHAGRVRGRNYNGRIGHSTPLAAKI